MKRISAYLTFDGNCREAMKFYAECLGAELHLMTFADGKHEVPKEAKDQILHARLTKGSAVLMASDMMPGMPFRRGNNFSVTVDCDSPDEIEKLFAAVGEKGKVAIPLQDAFWGGRFGMLIDQFGIQWMVNFEKARER